jgi:hypothetical protein
MQELLGRKTCKMDKRRTCNRRTSDSLDSRWNKRVADHNITAGEIHMTMKRNWKDKNKKKK